MVPEELNTVRFVQALAEREHTLSGASADFGEITLELVPEALAGACALLKRDFQFVRLSSVTATDWYPMEPRFHVTYHLHSIDSNERVRLVCKLSGERPEIDSVYGVWRSADWYEREVFDLFGIRFRNHPNLRRILMPDDWNGHPLRKDFPVHGHKYSYQNE
jgi:NADH-quinone oxidoreductase subunit C